MSARNTQLGTATQNGAIINDDTDVSIVVTDAVKAEGDSGTTSFTFTITRTGVTNIPDNVSWNVTGNGATDDDFLAGVFPAGVAQFASNQTSRTITIDVAGDLDVEGDELETGKESGKDAEAGKSTFVSEMGIENARARAEMLIEQAIRHLKIFDGRATMLVELANYVLQRRA